MKEQSEELLQFFKTFVDVERLKIVGTLAKNPASIQTLAEDVNMSASEVLHHIEQLKETGLLTAHLREDDTEVFELNAQTLADMAKRQFSRAREQCQPAPDERQIPADFTHEERTILFKYTRLNGEIKQIPPQQKRQLILIRYARHYVLKTLTPGKQYTEKEINTIIQQLHPDFSFFRRNLVDTGYLDRYDNGSAYWLTEKAISTVAKVQLDG